MHKEAISPYAILDLIKKRWSPRAFSDKKVATESIQRIIAAAGWSASSYNEQPWRFIVGVKNEGDTYEKVMSCLNPFNEAWAKSAPVALLIVSKNTFSASGKTNRHAWYDCGGAAAFLSLQATAEGLYLHQMAGISPEKAREVFQIPSDYTVVSAMAIGYLGKPEQLPESLQSAEKAPRTRKTLSEITFGSTWGTAHELTK